MTQHMGWGPGWGGWAPPPPPRPGVIPLAPLGVGDVLGGALSALGRHWKQLLGLAAAAYGVVAVVFGGALVVAYSALRDEIERLPHSDEGLAPLLFTLGGLYVVGVLLLLVANAVIYASCPAVLQDAVLGRTTTLAAVWRRVRPRLAAVLGTVLLTSLIALVPLLLFAVAFGALFLSLFAALGAGDLEFSGYAWVILFGFLGALLTGVLAVWLWVRFSLAPAAAVFEGQGTLAAMTRSAHLVRGSWWRIFGISLAGWLLAAIASYLIQLPFSLLSMAPGPAVAEDGQDGTTMIAVIVTALVFGLLTQVVGQILTAAYPQLVTGLLYVDQRIRKENLAPALAEAAAVPSAPVTT
ncbi:hypothetical protein [Streptomyces sp. NRRL S-118]|uniref:DUF7847 domain-containing protein n=1 Tax=Streptomyces sp. NRRL S-118 TaxID=1463881 RepID=UPI001F1B7CF4|nr:hypothetical protein [Streptomyces sp. NRRL S-118]